MMKNYVFQEYDIYIFLNINQHNLQINQNTNKEERRSGTIRTGVSQKELQINEKTEKEKNTKKLVELNHEMNHGT